MKLLLMFPLMLAIAAGAFVAGGYLGLPSVLAEAQPSEDVTSDKKVESKGTLGVEDFLAQVKTVGVDTGFNSMGHVRGSKLTKVVFHGATSEDSTGTQRVYIGAYIGADYYNTFVSECRLGEDVEGFPGLFCSKPTVTGGFIFLKR